MCLAIPGQVIEIENDDALIEYGGLKKRASLRLFPEVKIGDYVLVHAGFVIQQLDEEQGKEMIALAEEMAFDDC